MTVVRVYDVLYIERRKSDGDFEIINCPLEWFPKLLGATRKERNNFRLIGVGAGDDAEGIHWPDLDEDLNIAELFVRMDKWLNRGTG